LSTPFQNRLVGTIIVAAAAIIFLPDILNGEKKAHKDTFEAMPSAPTVSNVAAIKKFPSKKLSRLESDEISDDVAADQQLLATENKTNESIAKAAVKETNAIKVKLPPQQTPKVKSKKVPNSTTVANKSKSKVKQAPVTSTKSNKNKVAPLSETAWEIQLGSFRERHNVDNLIKKLKKHGYTAYSKPIKTRHGNLIKVFVGPELSKSLLESKLKKLKKLTNMQGKIAKFKPDN